MAKLKTPLLSFAAHNTIGKAITFQSGSRLTIARTKPIPSDPKSPAQLIQRQKYRDAVTAWNALSPGEKEDWRGVCRGLTAYQCFIKSELAYVPPPPPPPEFTEEQTDHSVELASLRAGSYKRAAQRLTITARTVTKLAFYIRRIGAPTGDVTFTIRKVSDDSLINSKVWGDAADLPTTGAWQEAEFDSPVSVNQEVRISVEFYGGSMNNEVRFVGVTADVKPGEWFEWFTAGSVWAKPAEWDFAYIYTYY